MMYDALMSQAPTIGVNECPLVKRHESLFACLFDNGPRSRGKGHGSWIEARVRIDAVTTWESRRDERESAPLPRVHTSWAVGTGGHWLICKVYDTKYK
jgi:hypothetical protein